MKQESEVNMMRPKRNLGRTLADSHSKVWIGSSGSESADHLLQMAAASDVSQLSWDFYKSQARDALSTNGNVPSMGGALFFFGTTARQQRTTCTKCSTAKCRLLDDYKRNESPRHETTSGVCLFSGETDDICLNNK